MCFSYCMYMSIQYTSVVVFRFIMKVIIFTTILLFMDYFWVKHCSMMSGLLVSFNTNHRCVIGYNTHQKPHQTLYIYTSTTSTIFSCVTHILQAILQLQDEVLSGFDSVNFETDSERIRLE